VHDASVLKAFSPHFAIAYLVRNGTDGWRSLGGVLLCFTGVEAIYADLGAPFEARYTALVANVRLPLLTARLHWSSSLSRR
jgi:K+ transporter